MQKTAISSQGIKRFFIGLRTLIGWRFSAARELSNLSELITPSNDFHQGLMKITLFRLFKSKNRQITEYLKQDHDFSVNFMFIIAKVG